MTPNPYIVNCPTCGKSFEPDEAQALFETACPSCRADLLVIQTSRGPRAYALERIGHVATRIKRGLGIDHWREFGSLLKDFDSMDTVEYVMRLEEEFGEKLESPEEFESFPDMIDWLIRRMRLFHEP
jgi:DNA-directed RNA polymerase subunit RPC12/RpoP